MVWLEKDPSLLSSVGSVLICVSILVQSIASMKLSALASTSDYSQKKIAKIEERKDTIV